MQYYLLIILGIIIIPLIAQLYITVTYKRFLKKENRNAMSGYDTARKILDNNELSDMYIVQTNGFLSDHYDPRSNVIRLSDNIYNTSSIAAASVAAHECGHALQNKDGYIFMKIRTFLVPIVNISSKFAYIMLLIGFLLEFANLIELAIILMSLGILFQFITLPVEFNASNRAKKELTKLNILNDDEIKDSSKMLRAAAFTYVAGLISNLLELLRLILIFNNRD